MRKIFIALLMLVGFAVYSQQWYSIEEIDDFSGEKCVSLYYGYSVEDFYIAVTRFDGKIGIFIRSSDRLENNKGVIFLRFDDERVIQTTYYTGSNTRRNMFIHYKFIQRLFNHRTLRVKFYNYDSSHIITIDLTSIHDVDKNHVDYIFNGLER